MFAHQGGWDEILLVAAPIAAIAALLWVAKRRVDRMAAVSAVGDRGDDEARDTDRDGDAGLSGR